ERRRSPPGFTRAQRWSDGDHNVAEAAARDPGPGYSTSMLTVEEAREQILARVTTLAEERVPLLAALDRVLAEAVTATREIPPWPNSSMDGYAVRAADTRAGSGVRLAVVGRVAAGGMPDRPVAPGTAMRIFTGAPMPDGADAVIPQEDVE